MSDNNSRAMIDGDISPEEAFIGAILDGGLSEFQVYESSITAEDFQDGRLRAIFERLKQFSRDGQDFDLIVLADEMKGMAPEYILKLVDSCVLKSKVDIYARQIKENSIRRKMLDAMRKASVTPTSELVSSIQDDIWQYQSLTLHGWNLKEAIKDSLDYIEKRMSGTVEFAPGFIDLDIMLGEFERGDVIIIGGRPGHGKCLARGTRVVMFDGSLKSVENIIAGDILMGDDSTQRVVKSTITGREQMYWIRQNKGVDYRVNESHVLSLKRSRNNTITKNGDVLNISVKDLINKSAKFKTNYKGYKTAIEFQERGVELDPYFLGLWLGDGNSRDGRIHNTDTEIIQYFNDYAEQLNMKVSVGNLHNNCHSYSIIRKQSKQKAICWYLREYNLICNKHIPKEFLINSKENRLKLLAGLIDSDGHLNRNNGVEITQTRKRIAYQIKYLCDTLGFRTSIAKGETSCQNGYKGVAYRVLIYGDVSIIPTRVRRKIGREWGAKVDWRVTGIKVEKDVIDNYYGFEIGGDKKLFLLEDMTVTHNSALSVNLCMNQLKTGKNVYLIDLETSYTQMLNRFIGLEAGVAPKDMKDGHLSPGDLSKIIAATARIREYNLTIHSNPSTQLSDIASGVKASNADIVFLDYINLLESYGKPQSTNDRITEQIRGLKKLAMHIDIPFVVLSQLNRKLEERDDKRPRLSDFRDSGSLEQVGDVILATYWAHKYDEAKPENEIMIRVLKQKVGDTSDIMMEWNKKIMRFRNYSGGTFG